jgi:hypothetical protein
MLTLVAYPLAAMAGALVGTVVHEATHAALAIALGQLEGVGWQGGLAGGPFVDFRAPTRARSEVIRKAPLVVGLGGAAVVVTTATLSVAWTFGAAVVAGLLWTSPADLFLSRSQAAAGE